MIRRRLAAVFVLGLSGAVARPAAGQSSPDSAHPDSVRIVRAARSAQRNLERTRRDLLPRGYTGYGPCDIRIGMHCYWLFTDDPKPPTFDPPELSRERTRLVALLDSAVKWERHGGWSRGQRVRYLVEEEDYAEAARTATGCAPEDTWWCHALQGYVAHIAGRFPAAERAYRSALERMPPEERCAWEDISQLLSGKLRGQYRDLECDARATLQRRILWLADPLYLIPGNEIWTEHLTRRVYGALRTDAHGVAGRRWTRSMYRGMVRYGRPVWWEKDNSSRWGSGDEGIITHHTPNGRYYFPRVDDVDDLSRLSVDSWSLKWRRAPATHPPGHDAAHLDEIHHELTWWPMGDSTAVIALVEVEDDSLIPGDSLRFFLAGSSDPTTWHTRDSITTAWHTALQLVVPSRPQLLSIEVMVHEKNRAGRVRFGIDPTLPSDVAVSDLLVLPAGDSLPANRDEALRRIDPTREYLPGDEIHLYWEFFARGGEPTPVQAALQLRKTGRSLLRRIAELTPLASHDTPVSLAWRELVQPDHELFPWGMSVTLPEEVSDGEYTFRLELQTASGERFERTRKIRIAR